jgi:hypothetical protein
MQEARLQPRIIELNKQESGSNLARIIGVSSSLQQELDNISQAIFHCVR